MQTNFRKSNVLVEEIWTSFKGEPGIMDQNYSINKEFWLWKTYHFLSAMEIEERSWGKGPPILLVQEI